MRIAVTEQIGIACDPDRAFHHSNEAANLTSFVGFGPIPGIREAHYLDSGPIGVGSKRSILKSDGTTHVEEITAFVPGRRHVSRIAGLTGIFRIIVRDLQDVWEFTSAGGNATLVTRSFIIDVRSSMIPVALVLVPLLRQAIRRDLRNTRRAIESMTKHTPR